MNKIQLSIFLLLGLGLFIQKIEPNFDAHSSKQELGRYLFFDTRISINRDIACATCHNPDLAFTDGYKQAITGNGNMLSRNTPTLINISKRQFFNWANTNITSLEDQMQRPLFNEHPEEMGWKGNEKVILQRIASDNKYIKLFKHAFPTDIQPITVNNCITAIAEYQRGLISYNAKYDEFLGSKDSSLFSQQEKRGMLLFFSDTIGCSNCHGGIDFHTPAFGNDISNIGLYNCDNKNTYPNSDRGLMDVTNDPMENGWFRIPTLRNVAITGPYFHDGSTSNLSEVIDIYARGGRQNTSGNCVGDGRENENKDGRLLEFKLTMKEKKSLIAFLSCLTDTSYLTNEYFLSPY